MSKLATSHSSSTRKKSKVEIKHWDYLCAWNRTGSFFCAEFGPEWGLNGNSRSYCTFLHRSDISTYTDETLQCPALVAWCASLNPLVQVNTLMKSWALLVTILSKVIFFAKRSNGNFSHSHEHASSVIPMRTRPEATVSDLNQF